MPAHHPFSLTLRHISVERADRSILVDVDLTLTEKSRVAIVGPNGVGKSTLLRVMAGELTPDAGTLVAAPPTLTVGLLDQELRSQDARSVRDLVMARLGVAAAERELEQASIALGAQPVPTGAADRYERALERYLSLGAADLDSRLEQVADELDLRSHLLEADPSTLSGGEAERVGLAIVMLSRFDLTLLDEPTNNLDTAGLDRLEEWVHGQAGGLVMVSHDRAFLERTITTVVEIDHHAHTAREFGGGWQAFMTERERAAAHAAQRYDDYVAERGRLSAIGQKQREWSEQGASRARKNPADGDKHSRNYAIDQAERLMGKAKQADKAIERLEVVEAPRQAWDLQFSIGQAPRSATIVAALDRAVLTRGSFALGPVDLEIRWAERVALVGPNGSGKSTLIDALLGRLAPTVGQAKLGSGVVVGELNQTRSVFVGDEPLVDCFQVETGLVKAEARSVLAKFGLDAEAVGRPSSTLSPGERTRSQLALFQATGVNFLVLDEPTNHLDLPAIEQLESALENYADTLLLVSHDRRLLENVAVTRSIDLSRGFHAGSPTR